MMTPTSSKEEFDEFYAGDWVDQIDDCKQVLQGPTPSYPTNPAFYKGKYWYFYGAEVIHFRIKGFN